MKHFAKAAAAILLTLPLMGAEIIIPAAGVVEGVNGSSWKSDVTLHNAGSETTTVTMTFHDAEGPVGTSEVTIGPRQTKTFVNVVSSEIGVQNGLGALVLSTGDLAAKKLSVSSQTYTSGPAGQLGQDVPSYTTAELARSGDTSIVSGPSNIETSRFNFGLYAHEDSVVELVLYRADGTEAAKTIKEYDAMTQRQYNGVNSVFGVGGMNGDTVYARVGSGAVILYGSTIANDSNDPAFVTQHVTRENFATMLLGVDINQDGTIDIADADGDGVLDSALKIAYTGFPETLDIIVVDPEGETVSLELITEADDMKLYGMNTLQIYPFVTRRGTSDTIVLRASDGFVSSDVVIPVDFL